MITAMSAVNINQGELITVKYSGKGNAYIEPWENGSVYDPKGMTAKDLKKGEMVEYNPLGNTEDILVHFSFNIELPEGDDRNTAIRL